MWVAIPFVVPSSVAVFLFPASWTQRVSYWDSLESIKSEAEAISPDNDDFNATAHGLNKKSGMWWKVLNLYGCRHIKFYQCPYKKCRDFKHQMVYINDPLHLVLLGKGWREKQDYKCNENTTHQLKLERKSQILKANLNLATRLDQKPVWIKPHRMSKLTKYICNLRIHLEVRGFPASLIVEGRLITGT